MADVSVKMGVSGISQFKQGMAQAQASVKSLDAELALNEKQFKATGDAQTYLQQKSTLLQQKLAAQKNAAKQAESALKAMKENGVDPLSTSYQKMQAQMLNAQGAVLDTQADIQNLGTTAADATGKTDKLANSLGGINKKISLDQVISAVDKITSSMEKAGKKAVELGKQIWENITDSAKWADDTATQAMMLDMDTDQYQRYKQVFDTVGEITVQEWQKAKQKVQKAINDPSGDQIDVLQALGIDTHIMTQGKEGMVEGAARNYEEVFWEIGQRLREKVERGELTQDMADVYANALFGKGFAQLKPIFNLGQEGFEAEVERQTVVSEEAVNNLATLNDKLIELETNFGELKTEILGQIAPALTGAAEVINTLLGNLNEYLKTDEGQEALEKMGKAVEGLFSDLSTIDPQKVVEGFTGVFDKIISGLKWLDQNKQTIVDALKYIVAGWAALKLTGGALQILQLINGVKGLRNGSIGIGGGSGGGTGTGGGTGGGGETVTAGGGSAAGLGLMETLKTKLTTGIANLGPQLMTLSQQFFPFVADYMMHNTRFGQTLNNGGTLGDALGASGEAITEKAAEIGENAKNWWETTKGVYGDTIKFWENFYGNLFNNPNGYGAGGTPGTIPVEMEPIDGMAEKLAQEVGTVDVPANLVFVSFRGGAGGGGGGKFGDVEFHANGLPYVPFDGYPAVLHKGERVVPAREMNASRNFSSNLYVESMYMNNGQDAEGLAAAIAAANRRTMRGFGS